MSLTATHFAQGVQTLASAWRDVVPADRSDWQDARALENVRLRLRATTTVWAFPILIWDFRMDCIVSESPDLFGRIHPRLLMMDKL